MNKKMVCLDVDGTIVDFDGHMYPEVRAEIINVMEAGHHVLIATGRAFHATLPVIRDVGLHSGYSVCSNGGVSLRLDPELEEGRSEEHTSELQSRGHLVCRLLREKKNTNHRAHIGYGIM